MPSLKSTTLPLAVKMKRMKVGGMKTPIWQFDLSTMVALLNGGDSLLLVFIYGIQNMIALLVKKTYFDYIP